MGFDQKQQRAHEDDWSAPKQEARKGSQDWSDEARFEAPTEISDLERERGIGPNLAKSNRDKLEPPNAAGYFEVQGASKRGLGESLHLGEAIKKDAGVRVTAYEVNYNSYAQPLRMTYRAMGRLKDLSMTNAPLTPAEVEKDPKLMARFKNMQAVDAQSLASWSETQNNMTTHIMQLHAGQHLLTGAMANYSRVEKKLEAKRKEFERSNKLGQIAEVDRAVATIHKIVNVTTEAIALARSIDGIVGSAALDEDAAYGKDDGEMPQANPKSSIDWARGTADDPKGDRLNERHGVGTRQQKVGAAYDAVVGGTAEAQKIVQDLKSKLSAGDKFELSLDDVLTAVMGGEGYVKLKKEVAVLDAQIRKLGLEAEADDVTAATNSLDGFKLEYAATRKQLHDDRVSARRHARNFGNKLNGGEHSVMAMYAAEAYQELAAFGELANEQRVELMPLWSKASGYLKHTAKERFVALDMVADGKRLAENLGDVIEQRNYFNSHLPDWKSKARQWSDFFGHYAKLDLMRKDNKADKVGD